MDHFGTTRTLYNTVVKPVLKHSFRPRIAILLDYVNDKTVLDLGCVEHEAAVEGKQNWWLHGLIKSRARTVKGVDYDAKAVTALREKGYDICVGDVEDLHLGETYEVIVAGELVEHLTNHRSFFESVKRHLAPGGIVVASVPNANSLNYFMQTLVFGHEVDAWDHACFFTPVTLAVLLRKCGLELAELVLYQPRTIFHHSNRLHGLAATCFNAIQQCVCRVQPSLSRGIVAVAKAAR